MKTILVPTDFSENAAHASLYAGMLAKRFDAKVILLNVYPVYVPVMADPSMIYDTGETIMLREKNAKKDLKLFTENFIKNTGLPVEKTKEIVECGLVSDAIIKIAKEKKVTAIVMGTKGTSNLLDKWIGSTAEDVMESTECPCPVWVIPEKAPIKAPQTIMYAADFKEDEIDTTHKLLEIAKPLDASCKVVHIDQYFELKIAQTAQETIKELQDEFKNKDISFKNLNRQEIVEGLETYIKTHKPDVLALAIHEESFLSKIFKKSVSKHFIYEAHLPMLVFRKH
jgi:nucleotide-binding universal stress UspA family protein